MDQVTDLRKWLLNSLSGANFQKLVCSLGSGQKLGGHGRWKYGGYAIEIQLICD